MMRIRDPGPLGPGGRAAGAGLLGLPGTCVARLARLVLVSGLVLAGGLALAPPSAAQGGGALPPLGAVGSAGAGAPLPVWNQTNHAVSVSPSDTVDLAVFPTKGIFVAGTGGGAACVLVAVFSGDGPGAGAAVTISNLQPGSDHPYALRRVLSSSTTCVGILAYY